MYVRQTFYLERRSLNRKLSSSVNKLKLRRLSSCIYWCSKYFVPITYTNAFNVTRLCFCFRLLFLCGRKEEENKKSFFLLTIFVTGFSLSSFWHLPRRLEPPPCRRRPTYYQREVFCAESLWLSVLFRPFFLFKPSKSVRSSFRRLSVLRQQLPSLLQSDILNPQEGVMKKVQTLSHYYRLGSAAASKHIVQQYCIG